MATVKKKLIGHYNYYGITDNTISITKYYYRVIMLLMRWLNRRGQRRSHRYKDYTTIIRLFDLPTPKIKVNIYAI